MTADNRHYVRLHERADPAEPSCGLPRSSGVLRLSLPDLAEGRSDFSSVAYRPNG